MTNPTERFTNRVDTYVQARPSYPPELLDLLVERCGLNASVNHRRISDAELQAFFGAAPLQKASFPYRQSLDLAGVEARLVSSSYTPAPGQPGHSEMLGALGTIFAQHHIRSMGRCISTTTP